MQILLLQCLSKLQCEGLGAGWPRNQGSIPGRDKRFVSSSVSGLALGPIQLPIQSGRAVKLNYIFIPPRVFRTRCLFT
jgi:hypothetical protein